MLKLKLKANSLYRDVGTEASEQKAKTDRKAARLILQSGEINI